MSSATWNMTKKRLTPSSSISLAKIRLSSIPPAINEGSYGFPATLTNGTTRKKRRSLSRRRRRCPSERSIDSSQASIRGSGRCRLYIDRYLKQQANTLIKRFKGMSSKPVWTHPFRYLKSSQNKCCISLLNRLWRQRNLGLANKEGSSVRMPFFIGYLLLGTVGCDEIPIPIPTFLWDALAVVFIVNENEPISFRTTIYPAIQVHG